MIFRAETRRGKVAVNRQWDACKSTLAGDYILAVASKIMAQIRHEEVLIVLSQVLADLVRGEFQQLHDNDALLARGSKGNGNYWSKSE